ncbi:MarR family winged helix-turn-helix transcriptional regulator [Variovorax sp. SRS16]|uniref:MarR family winged helix-turn-helix transcriptional regulator n=1 Tax=Variovorax sp. SRS16 TaxID=282217 RepID=UPI0013A5A833|nr:MarR family winged helix-turn-helix transcriptional regulator [Variovorax sp. SRS16]
MADLPAPDAATCTPALNIGLVSYERVTTEMRKALPGITADQIQTFIVVLRNGRCSQIEISKATGFTRQATSRHVAKLVKAGLLVQRRDPESGRRRVVRLTARGRLVPASLCEPTRRAGIGAAE